MGGKLIGRGKGHGRPFTRLQTRAVVRLAPHAPIANARELLLYVINALNTYRKSGRPSVNGSAAVLAKCLAGKNGTAINPHHWSRPHALKQLATALATLTKAIKRRIQRHQDPAWRPITNKGALWLYVIRTLNTYRESARALVKGA